ncbi:uncharacterized protein LOC141906199 [Tubulanus polymorphus]|uniref:uncharacterized protein LOC141906199 n=1 Tax=Tubulanus polymorphus TaxID=672921 RepID=UPI003DA455EE
MASLVAKPSTLRQFQLKVTEAYMLLNEMNKNDVLTAMKLLLNLIERIGEILCDNPSSEHLVNHDQSHDPDANQPIYTPTNRTGRILGQPSTSNSETVVSCNRLFYRKRKNPVPTRYVQSSSFQKPCSSMMSKYRALSSRLGGQSSSSVARDGLPPHNAATLQLRQSPGNFTDNDTDGLSDSNTSGNLPPSNDVPQDLSKSAMRSDQRDENGNDAAFNVQIQQQCDTNGANDDATTMMKPNDSNNIANLSNDDDEENMAAKRDEDEKVAASENAFVKANSPLMRYSLSDGHHSPSEFKSSLEARPSSLSPYDLMVTNRNNSPKECRSDQPVFPRMYLPDALNFAAGKSVGASSAAAATSSTDSGYPTTPTSIKLESGIPIPASDVSLSTPLVGNYAHDALATLRESAVSSAAGVFTSESGTRNTSSSSALVSNEVPLSIPIPIPWVEKRKIAKYPGAFHNELHNDGRVNYRCGFCKKVIVFAEIFHRHLKSHVSKTSNDCEICNINFAFRSNLFRHIRRYHIDYVCSLCKVTFAKPKQLEQHLQIYHADRSAIVKEVSLR